MKVTRYFQSCILIEEGEVRILIDPSGQEKGRVGDFGKLDAILYTHEHMDHFEPDLAQQFADAGVTVYANASTAKQAKSPPQVVTDGQELDIKGLKVQARELPHCLLVDGSTSVQNTGYLVADKLFHPGDGKELAGLQVDTLATPLSGPDISAHDAFAFAKQVSAKNVIPIHYDFLGGNPDFFASTVDKNGMKTHTLKLGESTEI
ncbi:MAG TPA: MBL fold metallo-hydrolase [Candidatus Saccharimonadales bacterium]|nr:MBL fold metallo-hydrolase [Candidatus Saccharimonadales bacterium]